jgi:hypothetical protein
MMARVFGFFAALFVTASAHSAVLAAQAAPDFTAIDSISGKSITLSQFKGKIVVLEWTNALCPFVKKHYGIGNMQKLQQAATRDGVVWISINSGAEGNQGFLADDAAVKAEIADKKSAPSYYVRDTQGKIGKLFAAKTTPHMFVIDASGALVYQGAIDSISSADPADIAGSTNFVTQALAEIKTGKPVSNAMTQPYGCSVKY